MKKIFLSLLLISVVGCSPGSTGLSINDVWARPGLQGGNSAIYFEVDNSGDEDRLLAASSVISKAVEIHETSMDGDQMQMHPLHTGVPIKAGEQVSFQPGGLHIMLIGLTDDLDVGDNFDLVLTFEQAGTITIQVTVQEP